MRLRFFHTHGLARDIAGGGISSPAVQIANSFGADVTGVCGPSKQELVRSIGADHVIDDAQPDFTHGETRDTL